MVGRATAVACVIRTSVWSTVARVNAVSTRPVAELRRRSSRLGASLLCGAGLWLAFPAEASAQLSSLCPDADRVVVLLDGELTRATHPWADVSTLPHDSPLRVVTVGGPVDTAWARPAEGVSLDDLAAWLLDQPGVADVYCPDPDGPGGVELLPFPAVLERPDEGQGTSEPPSGRPGGINDPDPQPAPGPGEPTITPPEPVAPVLAVTGPRQDLGGLGLSLTVAGIGLVRGARRRGSAVGRGDNDGQPDEHHDRRVEGRVHRG